MRKKITLIMILGCMIGLIAFKKIKFEDDLATVTISHIEKTMLESSIVASGHFIFDNKVNIKSEIIGRVINVPVDEGMYVKKGQTLIKLDSTSYEEEVSRSKAFVKVKRLDIKLKLELLSNLKRRYKTKSKLVERQLSNTESLESMSSEVRIADIELESANALLQEALSRLNLAKNRLEKTTIKTPISGFITSISIKVGETVIPSSINIAGADLMTVADPNSMQAELRIDEADISNVKLNQKVYLFAASTPTIKRVGIINKIGVSAKVIGASSALTFNVNVLLNSDESELFHGLSCRAEIITSNSGLNLVVPISSIQHNNNGYFVWIVKNDVVEKRNIKVGHSSDTHQEVIEGIVIKDQIVTGPARILSQLKKGRKIKSRNLL